MKPTTGATRLRLRQPPSHPSLTLARHDSHYRIIPDKELAPYPAFINDMLDSVPDPTMPRGDGHPGYPPLPLSHRKIHATPEHAHDNLEHEALASNRPRPRLTDRLQGAIGNWQVVGGERTSKQAQLRDKLSETWPNARPLAQLAPSSSPCSIVASRRVGNAFTTPCAHGSHLRPASSRQKTRLHQLAQNGAECTRTSAAGAVSLTTEVLTGRAVTTSPTFAVENRLDENVPSSAHFSLRTPHESLTQALTSGQSRGIYFASP